MHKDLYNRLLEFELDNDIFDTSEYEVDSTATPVIIIVVTWNLSINICAAIAALTLHTPQYNATTSILLNFPLWNFSIAMESTFLFSICSINGIISSFDGPIIPTLINNPP